MKSRSPSDTPTAAADAEQACERGQGAVSSSPRARYRSWLGQLAIRPLSAKHRPQILEHLMSLSHADRYLRFGYHASDERVSRYVAQLNFERDALHGMFSRDMKLVAMSHLAFPSPCEDVDQNFMVGWLDEGRAREAEFGVSVHESVRGQRMGSRLYAHAVQGARARGMDTLLIHALSENAAMLHIVSRHGARIALEGSDAEACLSLSPAGWKARMGYRMQGRLASACHRVLLPYQLGRSWLCVA